MVVIHCCALADRAGLSGEGCAWQLGLMPCLVCGESVTIMSFKKQKKVENCDNYC